MCIWAPKYRAQTNTEPQVGVFLETLYMNTGMGQPLGRVQRGSLSLPSRCLFHLNCSLVAMVTIHFHLESVASPNAPIDSGLTRHHRWLPSGWLVRGHAGGGLAKVFSPPGEGTDHYTALMVHPCICQRAALSSFCIPFIYFTFLQCRCS